MQAFRDIFSEVLRALLNNKLRTFLTMFGVAWGVGSLLVLVGLGEGFRSGQRRQLSTVGSDVVMLFNGTIPAVANQHTGLRPYQLTPLDENVLRGLPEIRKLTALVTRPDLSEASQWGMNTGEILGVEDNYQDVRFAPVQQGRFLNSEDLEQRRRVVVLGSKAASRLFAGRSMIGGTITINGSIFTVIGTLRPFERGNDDTDNEKSYIPLSTLQNLFPLQGENLATGALSSIQFRPAAQGDAAAALAAVHQVIAKDHGFNPALKEAFEERNTIQEEQMIEKIFSAMDVFLGSVGVVTLGLGAVGIINIMLVSVTERTREIGLLMAIGATKRTILLQFFAEGVLLTTISGIVGIQVSVLFMWLLQQVLTDKMPGWDPPRIVPWSAALAIGALTLCGVAAGLYPASRAAQLSPIEALRRE